MTHGTITRHTLPDLAKRSGHKYDHGHTLIVSGGPGKTGAARLAARGALRIGAGLVTIACPRQALPEVASQVTSIMVSPSDDAADLNDLIKDPRFNAVGLGPGLGLGSTTGALVKVVLASGRACVLDADALSHFASAPATLMSKLHDTCVLTPHGGEFARLFPDIAVSDEAKIDQTITAAKRAGCVVLYKGATTIIATPDGTYATHEATGKRAAPWLATAGAGDALTGIITGLLARGFDPLTSATTATWLHVECARRFGPGLIAEDLPDMLPGVLMALDAPQDG